MQAKYHSRENQVNKTLLDNDSFNLKPLKTPKKLAGVFEFVINIFIVSPTSPPRHQDVTNTTSMSI